MAAASEGDCLLALDRCLVLPMHFLDKLSSGRFHSRNIIKFADTLSGSSKISSDNCTSLVSESQEATGSPSRRAVEGEVLENIT